MKEVSGGVGARYDTLPYPGYSFPEMHLSRLAAIGRLHGLESADPRGARILELGCGSGINLLAMAQLFPEASFKGVDVSGAHIARALEAVKATGISNISFLQEDLLSMEKDPDGYDYILCHGVYSWVPDHVRDAIRRIIRDCLKPSGIALVSYNCRPGWDFRGALRGMMMLHAGEEGSIVDRVARARDLVRYLVAEVPESTPYGRYLREESAYLEGRDDAYVAHDILEPENRPLYFRDFMREASAYGLSYLGDARYSVTMEEELRPDFSHVISKTESDRLERGQSLDFVRMRMFRSTLLCHSDINIFETADSSKIGGLQVFSRILPKQAYAVGVPAVVTGSDGMDIPLPHHMAALLFTRVAELGVIPMEGNDLINEVFQRLEKLPETDDRSRWRQDLERLILQGYRKGLLDLLVAFPSVPTVKSGYEFPRTLPLARWQSEQGIPVSGMDLSLFRPDDLTRKVITLCDGTRGRDELITILTVAHASGEFTIPGIEERNPTRVRPVLEAAYDAIIQRLETLGVLAGS
jgi:SAM-dependent methyltransferase